jgi:hypothetical protein
MRRVPLRDFHALTVHLEVQKVASRAVVVSEETATAAWGIAVERPRPRTSIG